MYAAKGSNSVFAEPSCHPIISPRRGFSWTRSRFELVLVGSHYPSAQCMLPDRNCCSIACRMAVPHWSIVDHCKVGCEKLRKHSFRICGRRGGCLCASMHRTKLVPSELGALLGALLGHNNYDGRVKFQHRVTRRLLFWTSSRGPLFLAMSFCAPVANTVKRQREVGGK